ncbi:MAG: esterase [Sediminibacterium sp.]|nr:esterase [Sediminibacterium sp.]
MPTVKKFPANFFLRILIAFFCIVFSIATATATEPKIMHWTVGGVEREALVYIPETAKRIAAPVVFVFHGHGGNMNKILRGKGIDKLWPEAIIVSPQGLNTPGQLTDPKGELPGWQKAPGDMNDRDLLFFDAMLKTLHEEYKIDDKRIYATGHSNGGGFTYLLLEARNDVLTAAAPSAAAAIRALTRIKPKPMMHIIGEKDPLVKPEWQEATIKGMLKINNCSNDGQAYATDATLYPSSTGNPVIVYKHKGGHIFPQEAVAVVIQFFKATAKP